MIKKWSKRWNVYHIREGILKNYKGMPYKKKRPVLVVSDSNDLVNKCLVIELGSNKNNEHHFLWYKYFSNKHQCEKESWIKPDCIHTVSRWVLPYKNRSFDQHKLTNEQKNQIISYIKNILNEKIE